MSDTCDFCGGTGLDRDEDGRLINCPCPRRCPESAAHSPPVACRTPGDWKVIDGTMIIQDHGKPAICRAYSGVYIPFAQAMANARLMAAAPALLAACESLLEACDTVAKHEYSSRWREAEREEARALIARAKGDAP